MWSVIMESESTMETKRLNDLPNSIIKIGML
jgi:hypothetical protein